MKVKDIQSLIKGKEKKRRYFVTTQILVILLK